MTKTALRLHGATPRERFFNPILRLLASNECGLTSIELKQSVFDEFKDIFNDVDRLPVKNGRPRWTRNFDWQKYSMRDDGVIIKDTVTNKWKITKVGIECYNRMGQRGF